MKILYSQIKELVPTLSADPLEVAEVLTMIGMMVDSFTEVKYLGKKDYLLGLETRNRVDCWSLWGVARELAAYYNLDVNIPQIGQVVTSDELNIKIEAREAVRRVRAASLVNLTNRPSPAWLVEFLSIYEMKSLNLLVDLSNYVMIVTGYASHLLDQDKLQGTLVWQLNKQKRLINTLDGSEIELSGGELVISDDENVLALAGLVGTQVASIDQETKQVIVEMAVYDGVLVKKNSRQLAIVTEAGHRLAKEMDAESMARAFDYLIELIVTNTGAELSASCDYYPAPRVPGVISFDPQSPSRFAGIEISEAKAMEILQALRCKIVISEGLWLVTPPTDRADLTMAEDLVEEVIRMNRYDAIPFDQVPALPVTDDLTSPLYYLKDDLRVMLMARGWDEVLSQPLVDEVGNERANYLDWQAVMTQNSVNEEFPVLRLSLAASLVTQLASWEKKNIAPIRIFEIGKVFGKKAKNYEEVEHLALLISVPDDSKSLSKLQIEVSELMGQIGLTDLRYELAKQAPTLANHHSAYVIKSGKYDFGIIYKVAPREIGATYLAELDLEQVVKASKDSQRRAVVELTQKLVVLDANLEVDSRKKLEERLAKIREQIGDNLWSLVIIDVYHLGKVDRYTVRVSYQGLNDQEAKSLHDKVLG